MHHDELIEKLVDALRATPGLDDVSSIADENTVALTFEGDQYFLSVEAA